MSATGRSTWSRPYLFVAVPGSGKLSALPLPALDATTLPDPGRAGLPSGERLVVRWRAPGYPNTFRRTFGPDHHDAALTLLAGLLAAAADPDRWRPGTGGLPQPTPAVRPTPARPAPGPGVMGPEMLGVLDTSGRSLVSPANTVLAQVAAGRRPLGSTVADVIDKLIAKRQPGWRAKQDTNIRNQLAFVRQVLVYAEPNETDLPEVAAWKRARLDLDGVTEGDSLHLALILPPDLEDALTARRTTDRRVQLWNLQAQIRLERAWARYDDACRARTAGTRAGGRMPGRPADRVPLRTPDPVKPRTEQLFLQLVHAVLDYADRNGLLAGPNPWITFAADGTTRRRPRPARVNERTVPPIGAVVQIAAKVAGLGRIDPRTQRPVGDRFAALVLTAAATCARPSELWALSPSSYEPGPTPHLVFAGSAGPANTGSTLDGTSWEAHDELKGRDPGVVRRVPIPRPVADAIEAHVAAGYSSATHLFTGPAGGPVRWSNLSDTYWKPAVAAVLGGSHDPHLADMPLRWLRKAGITWLLRAGLDVVEVADRAGHDPAVLWAHYAGVVHATKAHPHARHEWAGIDAAWAWAADETDIP